LNQRKLPKLAFNDEKWIHRIIIIDKTSVDHQPILFLCNDIHILLPIVEISLFSLQRVEISFYHFREWKYHVITSQSGNIILPLQRVEISFYHFREWKYHFITSESGNIILLLQRMKISFYHFREWKYHFITSESGHSILSLQRVKISFYHFREWT
jgi:hypothetical protein